MCFGGWIGWLAAILNGQIVAWLQEMGGYYIVNGQEKVIRMLILPRRNYVSFKFHGVCEMGEVQLCL